eukprot:2169086-Rhodomonas_salina.4
MPPLRLGHANLTAPPTDASISPVQTPGSSCTELGSQGTLLLGRAGLTPSSYARGTNGTIPAWY